ncbi:type II secretion system F family protein [Paenibacillus koleovorans]|uniref:type II secretion system F family protein n=1 Tax=Paenibacillus koleovorans TaxID=121608 RepID=UPI000FDB92E2|nr:type II secretion system F family protein [Paenibacillus koleovorans]
MNGILALALGAVERYRLLDRLHSVKLLLQPKMTALYGDNKELAHSKLFVARSLIAVMAGMLLVVSLFWAVGDPMLLLVGLAFTGAIPFVLFRELDRHIRRKKQTIVLELPELLSRMTLLLGAGETVQGAILRCAGGGSSDGPLQRELMLLAAGLRNREPFPILMERFSVRCAVQEVSVFTTTVLMNYKRGGDSFVLALKALSSEMWERRKALTRTIGEEASSKLIFPMLLIFVVVMTIVAAPAVLLMNQP